MKRRWSGRLKKAAIVLAVAGAAAFLFSRKSPEVETIRHQDKAAHAQADGEQGEGRLPGRPFNPREITPDRPEPIPEKDSNGFVSWIKKTFDAKSIDCQTRELTAGKGDNLDMLMDEAGVDPFGKDMAGNFKRIEKLRKFYGDRNSMDFLRVLEKGKDLGSLIGIINHLDIYYSDRLSKKTICSIFHPKDCVVIADNRCYNHRSLAGNILHAAIKSLARLALQQPGMAGRIIASLEDGNSQELFFESIVKETLEPDFGSITDGKRFERHLKNLVKRRLGRDFEPVEKEDLGNLEKFARNLHPEASASFYRKVSESTIGFSRKRRFLFIRDNTTDMQLARAIDKALERSEKRLRYRPSAEDERRYQQFLKDMEDYSKKRKGLAP
jgi:hypothetical protein